MYSYNHSHQIPPRYIYIYICHRNATYQALPHTTSLAWVWTDCMPLMQVAFIATLITPLALCWSWDGQWWCWLSLHVVGATHTNLHSCWSWSFATWADSVFLPSADVHPTMQWISMHLKCLLFTSFLLFCLTVCNSSRLFVYRRVHEDNETITVNFTAVPILENDFIPISLMLSIRNNISVWDCGKGNECIPTDCSQVTIEGTCSDSTVIVKLPATVTIVLEIRGHQMDDILCKPVTIGPQSKYFMFF